MSFVSVNPATGQVLKEFAAIDSEQAVAAVAAADAAYAQWRATPLQQRASILLKLADALRQQAADLARLITCEMGKRLEESQYEIEYCAKIIEFYAHGAADFLADQPMQIADARAYVQFAPLGVLLGIMPWNFPFYQVVRFAAPNLMAGNVVLIKHAANVPQCAARIEQLMHASGIPAGVYTNLFAPTELIESIIADRRVRGVSLTGSERAGAAVAQAAGKNLKRSVLELGGNDPFIVLEDVDLDEVVAAAVKGRMVNAGQSCVASKRFIVVQPLVDRFLAGFKQQLQQLKLGDPLDPTTTLGPLSSEQAARRLQEQVQSALAAGAKLVLGGDRPDRPGAFFNPTILTDVIPDMPTFDSELFGPVATVYAVADEPAAIALANHSSFGLGACVFTRDPDRGRRVAEQIEAGMVFLNQPTKSQAELPFGGIKNSGYGRELSELGILEFVNKKLIYLGKRTSLGEGYGRRPQTKKYLPDSNTRMSSIRDSK